MVEPKRVAFFTLKELVRLSSGLLIGEMEPGMRAEIATIEGVVVLTLTFVEPQSKRHRKLHVPMANVTSFELG